MDQLLQMLPPVQIKRVFSQEMCDIDFEFLGFTDIYRNLSEIIPKHFAVVDLGCAYAPQAFYFQLHKLYVGVDSHVKERFFTSNTTHFNCSIQDFVNAYIPEFDLDETFAIVSYVPDEDARELVRRTFRNIFCFYPSDKEQQGELFKKMRK